MLETFEYNQKLIDRQIVLMKDSNIVINNLILSTNQAAQKYKPIGGGWSILEVVCHLADFEKIFQKRLEQVLNNEYPILFSRSTEDEESARLTYMSKNMDEVLEGLNWARAQSISTIQKISPVLLNKPAKHKIYGDLNLYDLISGFAQHDLNHIKQITNALKEYYETI